MSDFDPSDHTVDEVLAHLESADDDERERVLLAESDGKDRASLRDWSPSEPSGGGGTLTSTGKARFSDVSEEQEFDLTEENAIHLLGAAASLGLDPSVVTTKNGRLQAPEDVVRAVNTPEKG